MSAQELAETQSLASSGSAASERMLDIIEKFRGLSGTSRVNPPANTQQAAMEEHYRSIFGQLEERVESTLSAQQEINNNGGKRISDAHNGFGGGMMEQPIEVPLAATASFTEHRPLYLKQELPMRFERLEAEPDFNSCMSTLGFSTAGGNKINISKKAMDKGRKLMEEAQPDPIFPQNLDRGEMAVEEPPAFSFGFQTGNNKKVAVKKENMEKAASLFSMLDSPKCKASPIKKATKPKLMEPPKDLPVSTVRPAKKSLLLEHPHDPKVPPSCKKAHTAMLQGYQPIKLAQLQARRTDMSDYSQPTTLLHERQHCRQLFCALCKHKWTETHLTQQHIFQFLVKKHKELTKQQFEPLYVTTLFKLSRYDRYFPELVNKRLTPSNVIYEIERKYFALTFQGKVPALLRVKNGTVEQGVCLNLVVMEITYVEPRGTYFIRLTDDWLMLFAVVVEEPRRTNGRLVNHHLLTRLITDKKLYVGVKIAISGWRFYPVGNILKCLDNSLPGEQAIEIFYNSTNKLPSNSKLGFAKAPFYRPLSRCWQLGGNIQLIEFVVVKKYDHVSDSHFYLRIADIHGDTYCMKVPGSEELASFYKPKDCYQMRKLRFTAGRELEPSRQTSILEIKSKQLLEVYQQVVRRQLVVSFKDFRERGQCCDLLAKVAPCGNKEQIGPVVRLLSNEPITLKGELLLKQLRKWAGKTVLVEETWFEGIGPQMVLKQSPLTRIRTTPTQEPYKSLV